MSTSIETIYGYKWEKYKAKTNQLYILNDDINDDKSNWYIIIQNNTNEIIYFAKHTPKYGSKNRVHVIRTSGIPKNKKETGSKVLFISSDDSFKNKNAKTTDYQDVFVNTKFFVLNDKENFQNVISNIDKKLLQYLDTKTELAENEIIDFSKIKDFFEKYHGQKYKSIYKDMKTSGQNAVREYSKFLDKIKNKAELKNDFKYHFPQNSYIYGYSYCSEYFWGQFKKYDKEPYSITVVIGLDRNNDLELYVKTEIYDKQVENANATIQQLYVESFLKSTWNIPDGFYKENNSIGKTNFNKTNIIRKINLNQKQNNIIKDTQEAIQSLIPNYLAIFDEEPNGVITMTNTEPAKNQILYGPPGTGKTYNTVVEAMKIIDKSIINYDNADNVINYPEVKEKFDEYKKEGRIEFITFHQSYSYEEFVEGIKPSIIECDNEHKELIYSVEEGIFKNICQNAKGIKTEKVSQQIDFSKTRIFKMSLGANWEAETEYIFNYCINNNVVALGWGDDIDFSDCKTSQDFKNHDSSWGAKAVEIFKNWMRIGDIILISNGNSFIKAIAKITGEYEYHNDREIRYCQFRQVEWLYTGDNIPISKIYDKKLSQQTIYGFYSSGKEGKKDYNTIKTDVLNEIITGTINKTEEPNYVLIIDEINRGNISKIFGELITLIEKDKRLGEDNELKVTLPYSQEPFGVPNNLYIIGTMNTADRSIASVDIALRRRFKFIEMMPDNNSIPDVSCCDINIQDMFKTLNKRICALSDRDHQIGHSYFIGLEENQDEKFRDIWFDSVMPLLNEYFYNDFDKLQAILGKAERENKNTFIEEIKTDKIFASDDYSCDDDHYFNFRERKYFDDMGNFKEALKIAFPNAVSKE